MAARCRGTQQARPQSFDTLKSYFAANPKVAGDLQTIAQPLTGLSTQCKLPISLPQAMGLVQQAQGAGAVPGLPGGASPAGAPGAATGGSPAGVAGPPPPSAPATPVPSQPRIKTAG
jgi:heme-binding protein